MIIGSNFFICCVISHDFSDIIVNGSHIFGLTNFPDFSSRLFPFSSIFSLALFNEFHKYKNLFNKYMSIKKSREENKNINWLKFHFSSILGKIP